MLDLSEFLLDLGDVVAIRIEELGLVLLDYVLNFLVHLVDCLIEVFIGLEEWLGGLSRDKLPLALHLIKLIDPGSDTKRYDKYSG